MSNLVDLKIEKVEFNQKSWYKLTFSIKFDHYWPLSNSFQNFQLNEETK